MVHKWNSKIILITLLCALNFELSAEVLSVDRFPISVNIKKVENACSDIILEYTIEDDVTVPYGSTGIKSGRLLMPVLGLTAGAKYIPMSINSPTSTEVKSEVVKLSSESLAYSVTFNLKDYFPSVKGKFYLDYFFDLEAIKYQAGDTIIWVNNMIKSSRTYIEIEEDGCISTFFY